MPAAVAAGSIMSLLFPQAELVASKQAKVWVGDGLPATLKKLHTHILNWKCVDLAELRPVGPLDKMNPVPDPQRFIIMPGMEVTRAAKKSIEDILTWVQCFTTYVAILSTKFPEAVPDLMAYMLSIIWAYQKYEHPQWRNYNEAFRDKAATTGNRKWSVIDSHLSNQIFTGKAHKLPVCTHCGASTHHTEGCPLLVHVHEKG